MSTLALQSFETESSEGIEIPFILRCADRLHGLSETTHNILSKPCCIAWVYFQPVQPSICEFHVHGVRAYHAQPMHAIT